MEVDVAMDDFFLTEYAASCSLDTEVSSETCGVLAPSGLSGILETMSNAELYAQCWSNDPYH